MNTSSSSIIVLNGTSSSGKTTIAKKLQAASRGYYLHLALDLFTQTLPEHFISYSDGESARDAEGLLWVTENNGQRFKEMRLGPKAVKFKEALYRTSMSVASTGFDVIVDDVIIDDRVLESVSKIMTGNAYFVGIYCAKEEAIRREEERGDRLPGMVEAQYDLVHKHGCYDLEIDTSIVSVDESVKTIQKLLASGPPPTAFQELSDSFS